MGTQSPKNAATAIKAILTSFAAVTAISLLLMFFVSFMDVAGAGVLTVMALYFFYALPVFAISSIVTYTSAVRQISTIEYQLVRFRPALMTGKAMLVLVVGYALFLLVVSGLSQFSHSTSTSGSDSSFAPTENIDQP